MPNDSHLSHRSSTDSGKPLGGQEETTGDEGVADGVADGFPRARLKPQTGSSPRVRTRDHEAPSALEKCPTIRTYPTGAPRTQGSLWEDKRRRQETRLDLATLTLARYRSNSVFRRGRKRPLNDYLPPTSTGIHADHTGIPADHAGVNADHKTAESWGRR